jgi:hypothetical protein
MLIVSSEFKGGLQNRSCLCVPMCVCLCVGSQVCAYLHWLPTQCNGSPITRYHVQMLQMTDGGESWLNVYTGPETKCEIINLKVCHTFRFIRRTLCFLPRE